MTRKKFKIRPPGAIGNSSFIRKWVEQTDRTIRRQFNETNRTCIQELKELGYLSFKVRTHDDLRSRG